MRYPFRLWVCAFTVCVVAVVLSVSYVDRPAAEFFEAHFRHTHFRTVLGYALGPFVLVVVLALFFLLGSGSWLLSGRRLSSWTLKPLLCSWSGIWALGTEVVFKRIFGRGWPSPTYLEDHQYAFRFLHGTPHWDSFPSGTAAISAAIASVLWIVAPRLRFIAALLAALLSILTNGHWISDVIAGGFLGISIGWMTVLLLRPELPPSSASSSA